MKAAGYTEKNADGFYVNADGAAAAFTLTVNAAKETHVGYAEMIKTQLETFGIQVNLDAVDKDAYNAKTSNKFSENNITMEAAIYGYTAAGMGMGNGLAPSMWTAITPCRAAARCSTKPFPPFWTN